MKKLTLFTASILLGFGLVSCKSDTAGASTDDKNASEKEASADMSMSEAAETVSIKVTGMT